MALGRSDIAQRGKNTCSTILNGKLATEQDGVESGVWQTAYVFFVFFFSTYSRFGWMEFYMQGVHGVRRERWQPLRTGELGLHVQVGGDITTK
jgi:hypothetical protein